MAKPKNPMAEVIGDNIKAAMISKDWTQKEFSSMVGITQASLNRILNGKHSPTAKNMAKISDMLGVSVKSLAEDKKFDSTLAHGNSVSFETFTATLHKSAILQHQLEEAKRELARRDTLDQVNEDMEAEYFEYFAAKTISYQIEQLRDINQHDKINWQEIFGLLGIDFNQTVLQWKRRNLALRQHK